MTTRRVLGFGARLSKLRAMSAGEIGHRLRYKAVLALERRRHTAGAPTPDRLARSIAPELRGAGWRQNLLSARRASTARFFPSVHERSTMSALFDTVYATERADTLTQAAAARSHHFSFFGRQFTYGEDIPWQRDPLSGRDWPAVFHADVPVHGGDVGYGDVKYVWELNRHQFLMDLGKSWFLTGNRDDVRAIQRLVTSWIEGNPYGTGVNWSCALEPAFRTFSWLWAYFLTIDALDDDFHLAWLQTFHDHGRFIERHLEHYTSPFNHLMGEAAALYMLGTCLPELADAHRWRATGERVLTARLHEQFYRDGGSVEQSTFYHHATVGFYLLAGLTARANGRDLSPEIWAAIERGLDFSLMLTQPDGSTPTIGGADDGKPIRLEHLPFWDFRPYLAIGAVVFTRGDFKQVAGRFHEDALWLLGSAGLRAFESLPAAAPRHVAEARPESGYYVLRSDWSSHADYVCFDCGEQAAGMRTDGIPNSMHGHADCLSLVAWIRGVRVLVDSGFYAYNAGGEWEAHFRETAAHNTARVDGRDQAKHIGKMAWSHSYRAQAEGWHADARQSWVSGSHDGYARGENGVRHRRTVWLRSGGCLAILDEFEGNGDHELEINFQFAPAELTDLGGAALFARTVEMSWASDVSWEATYACGGQSPADGWIAPSLGVRVAAPRLTLRGRMRTAHVRLLTVLAPRSADRRAITSGHSEKDGALFVTARGAGFTDVFVAPQGSTAGPIRTDARLAACRIPHDVTTPVEADAIGGTHLECDRQALVRRIADSE